MQLNNSFSWTLRQHCALHLVVCLLCDAEQVAEEVKWKVKWIYLSLFTESSKEKSQDVGRKTRAISWKVLKSLVKLKRTAGLSLRVIPLYTAFSSTVKVKILITATLRKGSSITSCCTTHKYHLKCDFFLSKSNSFSLGKEVIFDTFPKDFMLVWLSQN